MHNLNRKRSLKRKLEERAHIRQHVVRKLSVNSSKWEADLLALVFKVDRLLYHSTLVLRVIKKGEEEDLPGVAIMTSG